MSILKAQYFAGEWSRLMRSCGGSPWVSFVIYYVEPDEKSFPFSGEGI